MEISPTGIALIKSHVATLPSCAGVYRMIDQKGKVLYVGKARNLAKRVAQYTLFDKLSPRLQTMVQNTAAMEFITTETEAEALLLEANLIKHLKPRYNILLRDDKSFPYILLTEDHPYSQLTKHRGAKSRVGSYYGPFASAGSVNETISQLQKIFQLRPCSDNFFASRKRPCLQYQIKRCSGPCANKISQEDYAEQVAQAKAFLTGKSHEVQSRIAKQMEEASNAMDYEKAAQYRDRIRALSHIQATQHINFANLQDVDLIGFYQELGAICIQVFFVRGGRNYGNHAYFPEHAEESSKDSIIAAFLGQFYQGRQPPPLILLSDESADHEALEAALSQVAGHSVTLHVPQLGNKRSAVNLAVENARDALARKISASEKEYKIRIELAALFGLSSAPIRIEIYDNSHIMGKHAVGAMVVMGEAGFSKKEYRRYNMNADESAASPVTGGDDYAMLRAMLTRRLRRLLDEYPHYEAGIWPDLMLIDGGLGHLHTTEAVFAELGISSIPFACIAKGPERNAGREQFFMPGGQHFTLPKDQPVMLYLQKLRDEAHRYAITTHRAKRRPTMATSALDTIPGIGNTRKKLLLSYFGSVREIEQASVNDLAKIPGIGKIHAQTVYDYLHARK